MTTMKNKMLITAITIDNKSLFEGAKVKHKQSGKVREIFVLPEGMRISEAVDKKLLNMDTHVEYEIVMLNKHLFELVDETLDEQPTRTQGKMKYAIWDNASERHIEIYNEEKILFKIHYGYNTTLTKEEAESTAKQMVKCVNNEYKIDMHEELIECIKNMLAEVSPAFNFDLRKASEPFQKAQQLIKQSEQNQNKD